MSSTCMYNNDTLSISIYNSSLHLCYRFAHARKCHLGNDATYTSAKPACTTSIEAVPSFNYNTSHYFVSLTPFIYSLPFSSSNLHSRVIVVQHPNTTGKKRGIYAITTNCCHASRQSSRQFVANTISLSILLQQHGNLCTASCASVSASTVLYRCCCYTTGCLRASIR
ncbi:hypothetical protein CC86DRAFT_92248 [Ophiobolus disseminans]|uniref:Uncharacterized protein n=1 Tax=Ophiobolus disseminans TaxID=1469910 RepID=A0A6A7AHD8_9PLEO|nr:hypothetical protein CC86DRAFT_92248 [Ophiobolus disseminans]